MIKQKAKINLKKFIFTITSGILISLLWTQFAGAIPQVSINVKNPDPATGNQSWFVYTKQPGELVQDMATIKNFGDTAAEVDIYPVDAKTDSEGNFLLAFSRDDQKNIGTWTKIEKNKITLSPGQRLDIPFEIQLPLDLPPGQYVGGIVIEYGENGNSTNGNTAIAVKTRIGSRIYITIPGNYKEDINFTDFSYGYGFIGQPVFNFKIENRGTMTYEPVATIEIRNALGMIHTTFTKPLGTILPNTVITPTIAWQGKSPLIGTFVAKATVNFQKRFDSSTLHSAANTTTKIVEFSVLPMPIIIPTLLLILTIVCFFILQHFRFQQLLHSSEPHIINDNENIFDVASLYSTNWKTLAHLNHLHPPYIVRKGDTVLVPKNKKSNNHEQ